MSDTKDGARPVGWFMRFRRWLARLLSELNTEPAGGIVPDKTGFIDDGVDYSLPLVIPEWVTGDARAEYVAAAIKEASSLYHHQFDRPYLYAENLSQYPTADPLREWDFYTRREVLARCHLAQERNPMANAAVGLTTLFAMGGGLIMSYRNKDVERIVEEFRANKENAVESYEKTFCDDLQTDGELFVRHFKDSQGQTVIVPIPPWEIDYIKSDRQFKKRVEFYHQLGSQTDGTPGDYEQVDTKIPAAEVIHVTINNHSYEQRGRPELFRILPWLKAYKDWLEGRSRQNHWRGGLLWDVTLDDATPGQVSAKRAQYRQPPPPGSLVVHNNKEHWDSIESKVGASDVSEDGRQLKLMGAVGKKLPEYMLSDGQNSNLASASAQQLPALRMFSDFQDIMVGQVWGPIYRLVIENAVNAGILAAEVEEQDEEGDPILDKDGKPKLVKAVDAFSCAAPELESSDPRNLAEALSLGVTRGWVSNETAAQRQGYNYRLERKKIARERADEEQAANTGNGSGPLPGPGPTLDDFNKQDQGE